MTVGIDAQFTVRTLSREEGIFAGQSSGAAMWGAIRVAEQLHEMNQKDALIVVLLADSGHR